MRDVQKPYTYLFTSQKCCEKKKVESHGKKMVQYRHIWRNTLQVKANTNKNNLYFFLSNFSYFQSACFGVKINGPLQNMVTATKSTLLEGTQLDLEEKGY